MTTSHLYCIFNANDPTPTAIAIRSLNFKTATVFVVNQKAFTDKQVSNLDRLKKWINGSAKPEGWPEGWWNPDWDWAKATPQVSMEYVDELTSEIFGNTDADLTFVDLKGGTKAMSIDLMDYANERLDDPQFIFSNPGESLLLSKGVVLPRDVLGLNEIVFLASGYVMNEEYVPEPRIAEKIKLEFKFVEVSKRRFNKKTKEARFASQFLSSVKDDVPNDAQERASMEQRFLEEFASAMLSVSEMVTESVAGVRFVNPSFEISSKSAAWLLRRPSTLKEMKKDPQRLKSYHGSLKLLENRDSITLTEEDDPPLKIIHQHMHEMEIDALAALSTGELIGVECKYGSYLPDDVHRIRAICQRLSPRSIPVLVNSKLYSTNVYNVAELSFTELGDAIETIGRLNSLVPVRPEETTSSFTKNVHSTGVAARKHQQPKNNYKCPECDFKGKLGKLHEHLRENPTHWIVHCEVCKNALVTRGDLNSHKSKYGHPASLPPGGLINVQKATIVPSPANKTDKSKGIGNEPTTPINRERNALHCLPLIEIAVVSISSTGGNYSSFKRAMKRLQISMENMDVALEELGQKLGFETTNEHGSNWIKWNVGPQVEPNSADKVTDESRGIDSSTEKKVHLHTAIESLLLLVKKSPRSYSEFIVELRDSGFSVRRLKQRLDKYFADKLNFKLVPGDKLFDSGNDWIIWD